MSHHDGPEGVHQRRFHFCARLGGIYELQDLFQVCPNCERFFARCCHHDLEARAPQSGSVRQQEEQVCHHWPVIFTDGSCLGNGTSTPRGGIGYALGAKANDQFSLPFDVNEHGLGPPTSQMMELLAAIAAVDNFKKRWLEGPHRAVEPDANFTGDVELVVAADSEYVAIGISEWYPAWRDNGWRKQSGKQPTNLELFHVLDHTVRQVENLGIAVGFVHIPRMFNTLADNLARDGANIVLNE